MTSTLSERKNSSIKLTYPNSTQHVVESSHCHAAIGCYTGLLRTRPVVCSALEAQRHQHGDAGQARRQSPP